MLDELAEAALLRMPEFNRATLRALTLLILSKVALRGFGVLRWNC